MQWIRHRVVMIGLAAVLCGGISMGAATRAAADSGYYSTRSERGFNDEYVFATTRALNNEPNINPALKLTAFPVTIVLDTILLPFALIAGCVT